MSLEGGQVKVGKVVRNAAIGALVGSLFNRPGTGAGIGALTALGGGKMKTITLYYATWCGHCRNFKPEWEKLKHEMHAKGWKIEEWDIDRKGSKIRGGAEIKSVPCVSFTGGDGVPILYKGNMSASNISESASNIVGGSTPAVEGGKKGSRKSVIGQAESALSRVVKSVVDVPAKFLGMKGGELEAGKKKRWSMWGGADAVEGGAVEGGDVEGGRRRRRVRGGESPAVEGGDVEGGRRRRRVRGGESPVEGGAAPVEGGDVEGGRRRRRVRGGESPAPVEGGAAPVEGGDIEGGKRRRHRVRGGESPAVEGGDVEGGKRRHRMRGGESPVEGGAVEGGDIEGGKKSLPRALRMWNKAKASVERKYGKKIGVMRKGSSPYRMARKMYERLLKGGETETA